jgi:cytochrome c
MIQASTRLAINAGLLLLSGCMLSAQTPSDTRYAIGRSPTAAEITAWDIDIMPDGAGLPDGSGNVTDGRALYATQCQRCHGAEGGGGPFDQLAGRLPGDDFPFALDPRAKHTIGNYWPYATTIFDYTRRAMPLDRPGSLTDDEVYSLTAYLLYLNELLDEGDTLNRETLPLIVMPARDRFIPDDRRGGPEIR